MSTAFWALAPGPKMLTEFGELGFDYSINWCPGDTVNAAGLCRTDPKPIRWDYLQDTSRKKLHNVYAQLLALHAAYPALATGQTTYSLTGNVKYLGVQTDTLSVMVVGNFDVVTAIDSVPFPSAGTWHDYLSTDSIIATGSTQGVSLAPGEYHVYIRNNLTTADTTADTTSTTSATPSNSPALKIYPNPVSFSNSTVITYQLPYASNSSLVIYSITGQRMASIYLGSQPAGSYTIQPGQLMDPDLLPNGYYVMELITDAGNAHLSFVVMHM
jgi:hypothetical protein